MAFSQFRPDIGYVQGMAHIVGMLLIHCGSPAESFKVFVNLASSSDLLYDFYTIKSDKIKITYKVFWRLLSIVCPTMHAQLIEECMVSCSIFLLGWILTLFSSNFDIGVATLMWDQIFLNGQDFVLVVAISVCKIVEEKAMRHYEQLENHQKETFEAKNRYANGIF